MEFPKRYKPPKVENLASTTAVAWGDCSFPGTTATVTDCILNGSGASGPCEWGEGAGSSCASGSGF